MPNPNEMGVNMVMITIHGMGWLMSLVPVEMMLLIAPLISINKMIGAAIINKTPMIRFIVFII